MLTVSSIDRRDSVLVTTATGIVTLSHIMEHLATKAADDLLPLNELVDTRNASFDLSLKDLHQIADFVKCSLAGKVHGHVAVVTRNSFVASLAQVYNAIIGSHQPQLRVFRQLDDAHDWLLGFSPSERTSYSDTTEEPAPRTNMTFDEAQD